jgi:hypothetical protein
MPLKSPNPFVELRPGEEPSPQRLTQIFQAIQENFDHLNDQFPVQGGNLEGVVRTKGGAKIAVGQVTFEWPGGSSYSNVISTVHGLEKEPRVFFEPIGVALITTVTAKSKTNFAAKAYETNVAVLPAAGTKVTFDWLAIA